MIAVIIYIKIRQNSSSIKGCSQFQRLLFEKFVLRNRLLFIYLPFYVMLRKNQCINHTSASSNTQADTIAFERTIFPHLQDLLYL